MRNVKDVSKCSLYQLNTTQDRCGRCTHLRSQLPRYLRTSPHLRQTRAICLCLKLPDHFVRRNTGAVTVEPPRGLHEPLKGLRRKPAEKDSRAEDSHSTKLAVDIWAVCSPLVVMIRNLRNCHGLSASSDETPPNPENSTQV